MSQRIVEIFITTAVLSIVFSVGRLLYLKYFASPIRDFTQVVSDIGEDSPVIEALLNMRERYAAAGDHAKALEYSTKALERLPHSERIKELNAVDKRNCRK
jgi:tetratricopeptide (TPR) repeat protein